LSAKVERYNEYKERETPMSKTSIVFKEVVLLR